MTTKKKPRRQYRDDNGKRLPGVTTVLGVLDKPALVPWAARVAAEATAAAIIDGGQPAAQAIETGRLAPFRRRQDAADAGTQAHACVEAHYAGEPWPEDASDAARACARRAIGHIEARGYRVIASEWSATIFDHGEGWGGTLDLIVEREGLVFVADLKTGKGAFDSVVPQLAAYRHLWDLKRGPLHGPDEITGGGIVFHAPIEDDIVSEIALSPAKLDAGWRVFHGALAVYWAKKEARLPGAKDDDDAS
jgi:hypothetical protein